MYSPTRPTRPCRALAAVLRTLVLNLVPDTDPEAGLVDLASGSRDPDIRHLRIWNSVHLASNADSIRVPISEYGVASIDWIDEGAYLTWRGRGNLW